MRNLFPTKAQIDAARRNGARSRGPLTPQTRAKSALNARKHGLCAKTLLAEGEAPDRLQDLYDDLFEEFQPCTTSEFLIFEGMVAAAWRQLRARGFEQGYLADAIKKGAANTREAWSQSADAKLAARYETGHRRAFESARRELLAVAFLRQALDVDEPGSPATDPAGTCTSPVRIEPDTPQRREEENPQ